MADATYKPAVYRKQGGDELVIASGGTLTVESGGTIAVEDGASVTLEASTVYGDDETCIFGDSSDVTIEWDTAATPDQLQVAAAADDTILSIGVSAETQKSFDLKWFANEASGASYLYCDASANLIYTTGVDIQIKDDDVLILGSTTTNAETKITLEFDETTTGIGQFKIGDLSNPQVLNTNPGATVVGQTINILHSAGAGDCDDLMGLYVKTAVSGDGDSGTTVVPLGTRAYIGTADDDSDASEVYAFQPWLKHTGTGSMLAGSTISAALILADTDAFTSTDKLNCADFIVKTYAGQANGTVTSSAFDGVRVCVESNVTGLDSLLNLSNGGTSTTSLIKATPGSVTNALEFTAAVTGVVSASNGSILADISGTANAGYIKVLVGSDARYIPLYELKAS